MWKVRRLEEEAGAGRDSAGNEKRGNTSNVGYGVVRTVVDDIVSSVE